MSFVQSFTAVLVLLLMSATRVIIAQDDQQCRAHLSDPPLLPGISCEDIYNKNQQTHDQSGYYWILNGPSRVYCGMNYIGSSCEDIYNTYSVTRDKSGFYRVSNNAWVYCDMRDIAIAFSRGEFISSCTGMGGVWRRIASFNTATGDNCPSPWVKRSYNNVSFCKRNTTNRGCSSVYYSTNEINYQKVCGKVSGYQKGSPDAFVRVSNAFDYFEGLSITHGDPRQHIWTYAVGNTESGIHYNCPCAIYPGPDSPPFVGSHYYCESGAGSVFDISTYYLSDVLWDGAGCSTSANTCCSNTNLPWFYHELSQTTQDSIEVRVCMDESFSNEAVLITNIELFIQ